MSKTCLIFAYGLLKPDISPPQTMVNCWPDAVFGDLYDLGDYPAIINVEKSKNTVQGYCLEIDAMELIRLDEFEDTESGEYRRILTKTHADHHCWIYEYGFEIPNDAIAVSHWPPLS